MSEPIAFTLRVNGKDYPMRVPARRNLADGIFPRQRLGLAHVVAEHSRERAPGSRMLARFRRRSAVARDGRRWMLQDLHEKGTTYRVGIGAVLGRMRVTGIHARSVIFTIEEYGTNRQDSVVMRDSSRTRPPL